MASLWASTISIGLAWLRPSVMPARSRRALVDAASHTQRLLFAFHRHASPSRSLPPEKMTNRLSWFWAPLATCCLTCMSFIDQHSRIQALCALQAILMEAWEGGIACLIKQRWQLHCGLVRSQDPLGKCDMAKAASYAGVIYSLQLMDRAWSLWQKQLASRLR